MHEVENVVREGGRWGVLTDHAKVSTKFDLGIRDDKENIEMIKHVRSFSVTWRKAGRRGLSGEGDSRRRRSLAET